MKASFFDYLELCKPRVVALMILTAMVGMFLAPAAYFSWSRFVFANLGIALVAGAAATLNHLADVHIDKLMRRTQYRPIVSGKISTQSSLIFAACLFIIGMFILCYFVNRLTALLTCLSLIGYAGCYTLYLKHATPQNIVIGGIAGAAPPLLGWTAMTASISPKALLLVLIIYVWTPPHFWALAIHRFDDYAKANVPMLPHTHSVAYTKLNILLYTILLFCVSILPFLVGMSGWVYLLGITLANAGFLFYALSLYYGQGRQFAMSTFKYSIYYLGWLFILLLIDHVIHRG